MKTEFEVIELIEEPGHGWRRAYNEMIGNVCEDLRRARAAGHRRPEYFDWKAWIPAEMTDDEIDYLARRKAERATERAINERKAKQVLSRKRSGHAQ